MQAIFEVASRVSTPLALGGFIAAVLFLLVRQILQKNIFPQLSKTAGAAILKLIVDRLFILALVAMFLGFAGYIFINLKESEASAAAYAPLELPGETGWIFAGYFDVQRETFIEGPYVSVIDTTRRGGRRFVEIGDTIKLKVSRPVVIVHYKETGAANRLMSPVNVGVVSDVDRTGVILPPGTELVVRDVSEGSWPGNPNAALWLRVVNVPK